MKKSILDKPVILIVFLSLIVGSFISCMDSSDTEDVTSIAITDPAEEETHLAAKWAVGVLEDDLDTTGKLWEDHGFMNGSNVNCLENGEVEIYVDEDGSKDFEGNDMPSEAAGIIYSLDALDTIVGTIFEVELELPTAYPTFSDGVGVAQTVGIFEKDSENPRQQKGAFVNFGYCPGSAQFNSDLHVPLGDHHFSFGGDSESLMTPIAKDMEVGPLDKDLVRQTVLIKLEVGSDSIAFSVNDNAPYYVQETNPEVTPGIEYELRIMTHAATVIFGSYEPSGAPYVSIIKSVRINGEEISLCSN